MTTHAQTPTGNITYSGTMVSARTESSFIVGWSYSVTEQTMLVNFKDGRQYFYKGVPSSVMTKFIFTTSVGKTFNAELKGKYEG